MRIVDAITVQCYDCFDKSLSITRNQLFPSLSCLCSGTLGQGATATGSNPAFSSPCLQVVFGFLIKQSIFTKLIDIAHCKSKWIIHFTALFFAKIPREGLCPKQPRPRERSPRPPAAHTAPAHSLQHFRTTGAAARR